MTYKYIFTCFVIVFLSGNLFAQSAIGIYGGAYLGNFSGDSPPNSTYKSKAGYLIGLSYDIQIKEDVFISLSPAYASSGAELHFLDSTREEYKDSITFSFQLFTLPILLKIISDNKRLQFTSGLEFVFPLQLYGENEDERVDIKEDLNKVGLGLLFGIGYRIPINNNILVIDFTYSQGLLNMAENLDQINSNLPRIKATSFRLTAAWNFMLGKNSN